MQIHSEQSEKCPIVKKMKTFENLFIGEGIIFTFLGIFALIAPRVFALTLDYFLGWMLVLGALALGICAIKTRQIPHRGIKIFSAALYLLLGIIFLGMPLQGILTLALLLGFFFVFDGILKIYSSLEIKPIPGWGWVMVSGVLSLVLAALIFASWPLQAASILGIIVGINFLFTGLSQLGLVWSLSEIAD